MIWVYLYLVVGLLNYVQFWARRPHYFLWSELLFFVVFWPLQLAVRIFAGLILVFEWLTGRIEVVLYAACVLWLILLLAGLSKALGVW